MVKYCFKLLDDVWKFYLDEMKQENLGGVVFDMRNAF